MLRQHAATDEILRRASSSVLPSSRSDRERAAARSAFDQRPSSPAFQTASPSCSWTDLMPGLAAAPTLDHALHGFERVVIHRVGAADADHQCVFDLASRGNSSSGSRQVTGSEEPARNAKPSRFESATISLALAKLYERCLSL